MSSHKDNMRQELLKLQSEDLRGTYKELCVQLWDKTREDWQMSMFCTVTEPVCWIVNVDVDSEAGRWKQYNIRGLICDADPLQSACKALTVLIASLP